jgi:hypothetical protein
MGDDRVRDSHFLCEEQGAVPAAAPFHNGLMFPGDPNGPPEEVINCRCNLEGAGGSGPIHGSDTFDETKHARVGKGNEHGGQFTKHPVPNPYSNVPIDLTAMINVGGSLGGSNPGAQYKDMSGAVWYVKTVQSKDHALNELLAARLYNAVGVLTPELQLVKGQPSMIASRLTKLVGPANGGTTGAADGFAADALLANWDVVGLSNDNLMTDSHGRAVRIDMGGSLLYRAKGSPKGSLFGKIPDEINSLRDPNGNNKASAGVFSEMTKIDVMQSIKDVTGNLSDSTLNAVLGNVLQGSSIGGLASSSIFDIIKARRDALKGLIDPNSVAAPSQINPSILGKTYSLENPLFSEGFGEAKLFAVPQALKPTLPNGPQDRCMEESSHLTGKTFTEENWYDSAHPRPDQDGVPTNTQSHEFNRLFSLGKGYLGNWKGSATSQGASALKRAAIRVFNVNGCVYGNNDIDSEENRWNNDRVVRMIYRDTQGRLAAKGVSKNDAVVLFRGITSATPVAGAIEGHSTKKGTASAFDGHDIIKRWVSPKEIFVDPSSHYFIGASHKSEEEWLVFAGGFGKPASYKASDKQAPISAVPTAKIEDYSTGKKTAYTPTAAQPATNPPLNTGVTTGAKSFSEMPSSDIVKIKEMLTAGHSVAKITKATGYTSVAVRAVKSQDSKKAASAGPRLAGMKKHMEIDEAKWIEVKQAAAAQIAKFGKHDYDALAKQVGLSQWKARAIAFAKKKGSL